MKNQTWKPYVFFILLAELIGLLSAALTRDGMTAYDMVVKPALTPPDIVFPIVWTILYALMGIGAARIWLSPPSQERTISLFLFVLQLVFNFFWSIFFFNQQAFGLSFLWLILLWLLILLLIISYQRIDNIAAWLQVPYFLWVTFAGYLNYMAWMLNK